MSNTTSDIPKWSCCFCFHGRRLLWCHVRWTCWRLVRQKSDNHDRRHHLLRWWWHTDWCTQSIVLLCWSSFSWLGSWLYGYDRAPVPSGNCTSINSWAPHRSSAVHVRYWSCSCWYVHQTRPLQTSTDHLLVWLDFGTNHLPEGETKQWRIPLGVQIVPAGILAILILFFPESPRWLIDHGHSEKGLRTLAKLHARGDENNAWVRAEYDQIQEAITYEHEHEVKGYKDLFTDRSNFRRLLLVTALQASVQMTGVSAIQYFSPEIYATLNIGTTDALKYQGISNVLSVLAQLCTILFIDYTGRRWPLIIGNVINGICFIAVTASIAVFPNATPSHQHSLGWVFIAFNWIYQVSFSFTCGSLSWIIPAEVFDTATRSKGVSIGVMVSFAFNTMIGQVTDPAIQQVGWRYFLTFVVCNFTNAIFFWAFMPETARRPLEEMNNLFKNSPWFVPTMDRSSFAINDLEHRAEEHARKQSVSHTEEVSQHEKL